MREKLTLTLGLVYVIVISSYINCIQIDNRLVSAQHDCFERIALGAMLPFEKTFRNSDTNSLKVCENLCLNDKECLTFAFGISARGNGTCQLSSKVVDSTNSSPVGTIFDPDFDLYARKTTNCFVDPNPNKVGQVPRPGGLEQSSSNGMNNQSPTRPSPSAYPPTDQTGRPNFPVFIPPSSTSGSFSTDGTDGTTPDDFSTTPFVSTFSETSPNSRPTSSAPDNPDLYNIQNKFPTTYPTTNRYPQNVHPSPDVPTPSYNGIRPNDNRQPPQIPSFNNNNLRPQSPPQLPPTSHGFDQDRYPYPIQGPDPFPGYHPQFQPNYNYPHDQHGFTDDKDSHLPGIYAHNSPGLHYPGSMETYGSGQFAGRYPETDINLTGQGATGYGSGSNEMGNRNPDRNGYSDGSNEMGNRNPDRYPIHGNGYQVTDNSPDTPMTKPCFRRVLAGKRIASHWVRRTLICERLEDCQRECGDEKRFSCEGFNYRLDPSGQGECELIEMPLSQMDLYSSPNNRDSNLIRHPDYDYYERDRSSTNCRASPCIDCGGVGGGLNPNYIKPTTYRPPSQNKPSYNNYEGDRDGYRPETTAVDKYRPQHNIYESRPQEYDRYGGSNYFSAGGKHPIYRPQPPQHPQSHYPEQRPPPPSSYGFSAIDRYGVEEGGGADYYKPPIHRPLPPSGSEGYIETPIEYGFRPERPQKPYGERPQLPPPRPILPEIDYNNRPKLPPKPLNADNDYNSRPPLPPLRPLLPEPDYGNRPDPPYRPQSKPDLPPSGYGGGSHHESPPPRPGYLDREPPSGYHPKPDYHSKPDYNSKPDYISKPDYNSKPDYHEKPEYRPKPDYNPTNFHQKPGSAFVPYLLGHDLQNTWGMYGGTYGTSAPQQSAPQHAQYRPQIDYWGLRNEMNKRKDGPQHFNYFELGPNEDNSVYNRYGHNSHGYGHQQQSPNQYLPEVNYKNQWTRRPGSEECSVKSSEGFRLHKGVVRNAFSVPDIGECEKMCYSESKFRCSTFSYRYSTPSRDNCLLCDRSFNLLDYYADLEPDRNYDIYAMSDDTNICKKNPNHERGMATASSANEQCFIRSIDAQRFYKAIVRDSLTVRSIGECEIECIKANKFTCRSFTFRYGAKITGTIIDNCQLSDWPVRDMDKDRHLIGDKSFDVFERASYGQGCEVQPINEHDKANKLCYLGYGSAAKLLSSAIKKVTTVQTELECKNECIRFRESSQFKCLSFSFGSQVSTFNCEMSDLDQSELKLNVHYQHTNDRDFWLFAWNPFDFTCRDKITSISGNRINSDRRMDIFREPGGANAWRQFSVTVSGKTCRIGTKCEKNHISGFYSCEIENEEIGSWDYCCKNDHPCGYSMDFDYPWCFVGDQPDQWRTCSDRFFPVHTQQPHGSYSSISSNSIVPNRYPNKKGDFYQTPPRPGGLHSRDSPAENTFESHLNPIQYLHSFPPPNSTEISINIIDCKRDRC